MSEQPFTERLIDALDERSAQREREREWDAERERYLYGHRNTGTCWGEEELKQQDNEGKSYPKIEADTTEGINQGGFIIRFDKDLSWHWLCRWEMENLIKEAEDWKSRILPALEEVE